MKESEENRWINFERQISRTIYSYETKETRWHTSYLQKRCDLSNPSSIVRLEQERIPIILSRRRPFLFHFRFPVACRFVRARFWPNDPLWAIKAPRRPLEDKRNETTRGPETKSSSTRLINYPVARAPGVIRRSARRYPLLRPPWTLYRGPPRIPPPAYHPFLIGNQVSPSLSIPNIVSRRINFSPL